MSLKGRLMLGNSAPRSHSSSRPAAFICVSDVRGLPSRSHSIAKFVGESDFVMSRPLTSFFTWSYRFVRCWRELLET